MQAPSRTMSRWPGVIGLWLWGIVYPVRIRYSLYIFVAIFSPFCLFERCAGSRVTIGFRFISVDRRNWRECWSSMKRLWMGVDIFLLYQPLLYVHTLYVYIRAATSKGGLNIDQAPTVVCKSSVFSRVHP
ncbi:hypothetical protein BKA83DRAFT_4237651, partial [Pisolithus microcarpus]